MERIGEREIFRRFFVPETRRPAIGVPKIAAGSVDPVVASSAHLAALREPSPGAGLPLPTFMEALKREPEQIKAFVFSLFVR